MTTRRIVRATVVAALYVTLTIAIAPLSYGPIQFRIAEVLKGLALFDPSMILAFTIGNFLSNLTSPYIGPWELIFMPCANLLGATLCWLLRRWPYIGAIMYAFVITLAVGIMLTTMTGAPLWVLAWTIGIPEFILIIGGVPMMTRIWNVVDKITER